MADFANISFRRAIALLGSVLIVLTVGTWTIIKVTTDHLIDDDARASARNWAEFLATNIIDLKQIAAGEMPSEASLAILEATRKSGQVFRYIIFNRHGYSQLITEQDHIKPVDVSEFSAEAARSMATRRTIIDISEAKAANLPAYFARAYVPVVVDGEPIAAVAAFVDETEQRVNFRNTFFIAAISLCGLTAISFGLPAIGWYRRTREKQQADRRIKFMAHHDALTGLTNRARLIEKLDGALALLPSTGGHIALHFIDLDRFKAVNDSLGHDAGDFLLCTVAQRLSTLTRRDDLVARLGGDEFVAVQTGISNKVQAEDFARRVASVLGEPIIFNDQEIKASVTIGVALAPTDGSTSERLIKSADIALYNGKDAGRNCIRLFSPEMDQALRPTSRWKKRFGTLSQTTGSFCTISQFLR